jgi:hypothetical protein
LEEDYSNWNFTSEPTNNQKKLPIFQKKLLFISKKGGFLCFFEFTPMAGVYLVFLL